ncbi:MAG: hypothetical protein QE273_02765 [Verrucomicrobiales bacterium]|nr:hypothetical protein [Verrucomicrobiales bacterium]
MMRIVLKWLAGGFLSIGAIWMVTAVFSDSVPLEEWSGALGRNTLAPGTTYQERREGWATNHIGEHGLIASRPEDLAATEKIVIWGDSFVEAFHVEDSAKMHRRLTDLLRQEPRGKGAALAVGERFCSIADYRFRIPDYEAALKDVKLHVIHLYSLEDTFPDQYPGGRISLFLTEPNLHFEKYDNEFREIEAPVSPGRARVLIHQYHLQFFSRLRTSLTNIARLDGLRFAPGTAQKSTADPAAHRAWNRFLDPAWGSAEPPLEAWRFLLRELDSTTEAPILFVYAPPTPALLSGDLILENPEKNLANHFSSLCKEQGIGFVSLEEPFLRFLEENGRFAKGFHNSRPWEGHYNADGHRLVAEAINSWIQENRHVVYPD